LFHFLLIYLIKAIKRIEIAENWDSFSIRAGPMVHTEQKYMHLALSGAAAGRKGN
jgi:hypothetical protein